MTPILRNDVVKRDGCDYRILGFDVPTSRVFVIALNERNPLPRSWRLSIFDDPESRSAIRVVASSEPVRPVTASIKDQIVRDQRWNRIRDLVTHHELELFEKQTRQQLLLAHAKLLGTTDRTLLADLRRWWLGGQTQMALLGNYFRSGVVREDIPGALSYQYGKKDEHPRVIFAPAEQKARGRRSPYRHVPPMAIPAELRRQILQKAIPFYLEDEKRSLQAAADHVTNELFCLRDEAGNPLRIPGTDEAALKPYGQRPSDDQLIYMLRKALSLTTSHRKRVSEADFDNNHAPSSGSVLDDTVGPSDVFEIDATFIDLWVVAAGDRSKIIGKPTLYLVIDRHTRLIVGFHISLENPSWNEAKLAVLSVAGDWEALCNRLKVPFKASHWPAQGVLANRMVGDRAEMISEASNLLCDNLPIQITNPPACASVRKCIVESGLRTTQLSLKDSAPGYEPPSNAKKRRGKHYEKDACLTLDELARMFLKIIIEHNSSPLHDYPLSPQGIYGGQQAIPIGLWNRGIASQMGSASRYSYELLRRALMPMGKGFIRVDGLHFNGAIYGFDDKYCKTWQSRASLAGAIEVDVAYNTLSIDDVLVTDPFNKTRRFRGTLTSDFQQLCGYSLPELKALVKAKGFLRKNDEDLSDRLRIALKQDIEGVTKPAMAQTKAVTRGMLRGSRFHNAKDVRKEEAQARRKNAHSLDGELSHGVGSADTVPARQLPPAQSTSNVYRLSRSPSDEDRAPMDTTSSPLGNVDPSVDDALLSMINGD